MYIGVVYCIALYSMTTLLHCVTVHGLDCMKGRREGEREGYGRSHGQSLDGHRMWHCVYIVCACFCCCIYLLLIQT